VVHTGTSGELEVVPFPRVRTLEVDTSGVVWQLALLEGISRGTGQCHLGSEVGVDCTGTQDCVGIILGVRAACITQNVSSSMSRGTILSGYFIYCGSDYLTERYQEACMYFISYQK